MGVKSYLDANFDFEIVDEFLDHYSMMVDSMEMMIIDLSKPALHEKSINELFRVFHNIKSASGYLKIIPMQKLSAFVEDELEILRSSDKPITNETINWLLAISDMFAQWLEDIKNDRELSKIQYALLKIPDLDK
ncbi:MAG: chemotaxis protein CheA [Epsilonproteobacteria bacterium]|nr:chemotaxis protein CheA [Campylobacterota bacterium]OIO16121.1 MAG: chemotaxis protein CheA [Helicobacteraceae bacterium CG1_02_36_14]PIP10166.1 MAG: chemotaxis protein CheA [Sulfurimonas sp. CG23_combo_of_CG06-09_8_20_14_all_36_33]PIS26514.1 MAG: chemotaxis protein CheA [Sulfurimonas sp. CG08_land_8_20_14_0_20_36_33]PIU33976.1 MAG: chemotaxis protein CheA [Sulfurimonas sp. CG07_land_8_20_14_0_80_36_56]PIV03804.1 MAG: chemotaxis protein CheA [Sulfurimonas sp. CG03_land_8_20_14_0_80_36_25]P